MISWAAAIIVILSLPQYMASFRGVLCNTVIIELVGLAERRDSKGMVAFK